MGFRSAVSRTLVLTVLAVLVGAVAALLWANLAVLPRWTVYPDGHAELTDLDRNCADPRQYTAGIMNWLFGQRRIVIRQKGDKE